MIALIENAQQHFWFYSTVAGLAFYSMFLVLVCEIGVRRDRR